MGRTFRVISFILSTPLAIILIIWGVPGMIEDLTTWQGWIVNGWSWLTKTPTPISWALVVIGIIILLRPQRLLYRERTAEEGIQPIVEAKDKRGQQAPTPLQNDIRQVVEELRSLSIFDDMRGGIEINATEVLYRLKGKLAVGISVNEVQVHPLDKAVMEQLNLRKIVQLEQRRAASGPRQYDEGYWVLTERGKEVIAYLQANKQVLDTEGSQSLGDGIQPTIAEPEVSVNIDKSSLLDYGQQSKAIKYGQLNQQGQAIEVAFTVNVKTPPVNIADLQMYMEKQPLKCFSHDIKGTQRTNKECYTAKFEPLKPDMLKILKQKDRSPDKYQLFVVVDGKSWPSKQFPINYP